jgi:hypothetical protein
VFHTKMNGIIGFSNISIHLQLFALNSFLTMYLTNNTLFFSYINSGDRNIKSLSKHTIIKQIEIDTSWRIKEIFYPLRVLISIIHKYWSDTWLFSSYVRRIINHGTHVIYYIQINASVTYPNTSPMAHCHSYKCDRNSQKLRFLRNFFATPQIEGQGYIGNQCNVLIHDNDAFVQRILLFLNNIIIVGCKAKIKEQIEYVLMK